MKLSKTDQLWLARAHRPSSIGVANCYPETTGDPPTGHHTDGSPFWEIGGSSDGGLGILGMRDAGLLALDEEATKENYGAPLYTATALGEEVARSLGLDPTRVLAEDQANAREADLV